VACWVVLTSGAAGRFSENAFFVMPDTPRLIEFYAFEFGDGEQWEAASTRDEVNMLAATLRVEHLYPVMHDVKADTDPARATTTYFQVT
jgi:hypothetical protein